jgi:hypothetical protein
MIEQGFRRLPRADAARTVRTIDDQAGRECTVCGRIRRTTAGAALPAFIYGTEENGRRTWYGKPFCSLRCSRVFHGD